MDMSFLGGFLPGGGGGGKAEQEKTVALDMASGNQIILPDTGSVLSSVTLTKPASLTAENIKKDIAIGGVTGTYEGAYVAGTSSGNGTDSLLFNVSFMPTYFICAIVTSIQNLPSQSVISVVQLTSTKNFVKMYYNTTPTTATITQADQTRIKVTCTGATFYAYATYFYIAIA